MKKTLIFIILSVCVQSAMALDPSEQSARITPVSVYSGGLGAGPLFPLNDELRDESAQFLKLSFINALYLRENISLFMDIDWFIPGSNFGADLGFDYYLGRSGFRPFMGLGVGGHLFDKENADFGLNLGASFTAHAGFLLDLTDRLQIRVRIPYHFTANDARDNGIGLDIGFLFSDKFRNIKKLNY